MKECLTLHIQNSDHAIASALGEATNWFAGLEIPAATQYFIRLAIEELGTNWMKYSSQAAHADGMGFELLLCADRVVLRATDTGPEFNPLDVPPPPESLPPEKRDPGGLGILLLRKMADRMSYERRASMNIVTIEKTGNRSPL